MVRAAHRHWSRLGTRLEAMAKYGSAKLCNQTLDFGNGTSYICQLFKEKKHTWHIEKGFHNGPFTVAWKDNVDLEKDNHAK